MKNNFTNCLWTTKILFSYRKKYFTIRGKLSQNFSLVSSLKKGICVPNFQGALRTFTRRMGGLMTDAQDSVPLWQSIHSINSSNNTLGGYNNVNTNKLKLIFLEGLKKVFFFF